MPRVNRVAKARVDQGKCQKCGKEICRGDAYKWIKFRYGGRRVRCGDCDFKASDLTQSDFLGQVYDLGDRISAITDDMSLEDIRSEVEDIATEFENLASECEDKLGNMPEQFQEGTVGEMLQSRSDACNEVASQLQDIDFDEFDDDSLREEVLEELEEDVHKKELTDEKKAELRKQAEDEINEALEGNEDAVVILCDDIKAQAKTTAGKLQVIEEHYGELCDDWIEEGLSDEDFEAKVDEKIEEKRQEKITEMVDTITSISYEGE